MTLQLNELKKSVKQTPFTYQSNLRNNNQTSSNFTTDCLSANATSSNDNNFIIKNICKNSSLTQEKNKEFIPCNTEKDVGDKKKAYYKNLDVYESKFSKMNDKTRIEQINLNLINKNQTKEMINNNFATFNSSINKSLKKTDSLLCKTQVNTLTPIKHINKTLQIMNTISSIVYQNKKGNSYNFNQNKDKYNKKSSVSSYIGSYLEKLADIKNGNNNKEKRKKKNS